MRREEHARGPVERCAAFSVGHVEPRAIRHEIADHIVRSAIHGAANRGANDVIKYLAANGALLDVPDKEGRTPLDWAAGVFLATHPPVRKPETIALIERLKKQKAVEATAAR